MTVTKILIIMITLKDVTAKVAKWCQTQKRGQYYHLNDIQNCNNLHVTTVEIELEVPGKVCVRLGWVKLSLMLL